MPRTAKGTRYLQCADCGKPITRESGDDRTRCIECAGRRMITHAQAMRAREGPTYERVVAGQLRHWHAEAERLRLPIIGILSGSV